MLVTTGVFHFRAWKELADELGLVFDEAVMWRQAKRSISAEGKK